jgi:hypothetical protein
MDLTTIKERQVQVFFVPILKDGRFLLAVSGEDLLRINLDWLGEGSTKISAKM